MDFVSGIIANNYGSLPVVFTSGNGCKLTDTHGKTYLDFVSGIGVNCLGHNYPALVKAICEQAQKQIHISNYYNSAVGLEYAQKITNAAGMERVFFANCGATANEAAIKLARKFGGKRKKIITLTNSFHGRTIATLRATGQEKFHSPYFEPYPQGFCHVPANDVESLKNAFDGTVCAVLIECVQGEGGVNIIDSHFAQKAAELAQNADALVMVDEVQTGMGRTGSLFAHTALGIKPDVITLAKGIAGGIPMGACLWGKKAADVFVAGDHQSTFGGNPLACAAALCVFEELTKEGFLEHVNKTGEYMRKIIADWNLPVITHVRGKGLMIGIDVTLPPAKVQLACLEAGLCVSTAGTKTIRFLPPLILTTEQAAEGLAVFKRVLETVN